MNDLNEGRTGCNQATPIPLSRRNCSNNQFSIGTAERIRSALHFVLSNERGEWVLMGMAIKSESGEAGSPIWDRSSPQAEFYNKAHAIVVRRSVTEGVGQ